METRILFITVFLLIGSSTGNDEGQQQNSNLLQIFLAKITGEPQQEVKRKFNLVFS